MIITCGQCQTKFKVEPGQIKDTGSKVRCSKCRHVFTVYCQKQEEQNGSTPKGSKGGKLSKSPGKVSKGSPGAEPSEQQNDELESLSPKERRERRRRLYADLANQEIPTSGQDSETYSAGDDEADHYEMPNLRRGRSAAQPEATGGKPHSEDDYNEDYDETEYPDDEAEYEDSQEEAAEGEYGYCNSREYELSKQQETGLGSDPTDFYNPNKGRTSSVVIGATNQGEFSVRPALVRVKKGNRLLVGIAVVIALLAGGLYFQLSRPEPEVISGGGTEVVGEPSEDPSDKTGTSGITFSTTNSQAHYFRDNKEVGKILIITGMVRNSYPEARSFIKLRGILSGSGGAVLADRFIYAGNILTENELTTLPILEIQSRLNVRGGRSGLNVNVQPNAEIPFMLVFDKVPQGRESYSIDPVGSDPAK